MKKYTAEGLLLFVAVLWGGGFIGTHGALSAGLTPIWITAMRFFLATILFAIFCFHHLRKISKLIVPGLVLGFFLGTAFILQTMGLQYTTPSKNAFLTATNVIFTPFIYLSLTRKPIARRVLFSVILVMIGIALLTLDGFSAFNIGDGLTLVCAVLFAFHIYFIGYYVRDKNYDVMQIVFLQFVFATLFSVVAAFFLEPFIIPSLSGLSYVLYLAVFSTLLGFLIQNNVQRYISQTRTALLLSSEAAFGTLFSVLIIHERLTTFMLAGFVFLSLGIILAETASAVSRE